MLRIVYAVDNLCVKSFARKTRMCYARDMKDIKKVEAGRRGGFRRWAKISKRKRSQKMREVAQARWGVLLVKKQHESL